MPSLSTIYHILPDELIVCEGQQVVLDLNNKIWPQPCIQWQVQVPRPQKGHVQDKGRWVNLRNQTQPILSFIAQENQNGNEYRALVKSKCGCWVTNSTKLSVNFLSITQQPTNQASCGTAPVTFTALAEGRPVPTVQWQVSTNNGVSWVVILGATSTSYTFTPTIDEFGNLYRAVFSNTCITVTSNSAELLVGCQPIYAISSNITNPTPGPGYEVSTEQQFDLINSDNITSSCLMPKDYPGNQGLSSQFNSNRYRYYQGYRSSCITITVETDPDNPPVATVAAYSPTYDPNILSDNYLGDPGSSATSMSFSVMVSANETIDVVVIENNFNSNFNYTLNVSGLSCSINSPVAPCPLGL